nr:hypothetical protein GCM10020093_020200 [Planobispora longispora]
MREQKKQATREALSAAALRLALERGPDNVRVDDIAEAAGVSPRTYNNYFSSREQAIVAAVTGERGRGSRRQWPTGPPTSASPPRSSKRSWISTPLRANLVATRCY